MRFYLLDPAGRRVGPYSLEELELFLRRGLIDAGTQVLVDGDRGEFLMTVAGCLGLPDVLVPGRSGGSGAETPEAGRREAGGGAGRDFLRLAPHLMLPLEDLLRMRWLDNRRILAMAFVGLLPLVLLVYLESSGDLGGAIWGVALYSSLLWAAFFYVAFSQPEVTFFRCGATFAGSAVFSISLVALARYVVPFEWVLDWIRSPLLLTRWTGHLVGVAFIEEVSKLFMLYFLWPTRARPQVMMFYGLMAGLGFGIYEGVAYQSSQNLRVSFPAGRPTVEGAAVYYMLNILRLTSLPFLHSMWTGIAGYFVGFAARFPQRQGGLLLAAFTVPSLLHATYNTFSSSVVGLVVALVTVLALNLYLVKGRDFERLLTSTSGDRF